MATNMLHEACDFPPNWEEAIRLAGEEAEQLRLKDGDDYLPLHYACFNNLTLEVARALVKPFPEGVLVKGKKGRTALDYAISQGCDPLVLDFLRHATDAAVKAARAPKPEPERVSWRAPPKPQAAAEPEPEPEKAPEPDPWDHLPPLYASDREGFWALIGEGCPRSTLNAIRAACEEPEDANLELFMKEIGEVGAMVLGQALYGLDNPLPHAIVELTMNNIGDAGMVAIAKGMRRGFAGGQLSTVRVDTNEISDAGFVALAQALPPSVVHLRMGNNSCGDAGLVALAPALTRLPLLRVLNCHGNRIGSAGFASLAAVLRDLPALEQLSADGNQAGSAGLASVAAALLSAPSLRFSLELHDNGADEQSMAALERAGQELGVRHLSARDESETERAKHLVDDAAAVAEL